MTAWHTISVGIMLQTYQPNMKWIFCYTATLCAIRQHIAHFDIRQTRMWKLTSCVLKHSHHPAGLRQTPYVRQLQVRQVVNFMKNFDVTNAGDKLATHWCPWPVHTALTLLVHVQLKSFENVPYKQTCYLLTYLLHNNLPLADLWTGATEPSVKVILRSRSSGLRLSSLWLRQQDKDTIYSRYQIHIYYKNYLQHALWHTLKLTIITKSHARNCTQNYIYS